ncbi:hypothetical protein CANCADRAFT_100836 [Tortispora caseinolytica NRRL Y-17796]|uniref:Catalase core domain-containing protein n=1 Tax=Tortispora caseinolytica NRRL Y-17796 TaxID=767744 RepID=A0A1E4TEG5_9ASCO|nr:hypothetical protein CANCADRAFT_100836 [Tortispora caseinolytica NRRL Y-17796]
MSESRKLYYTTSHGCPVMDPLASQRIGKHGPLLLQDSAMIDLLAHFDRERIPERVVHANGAGAFGEFELTNPIPDLTDAHFLTQKPGYKVKTLLRFSTVGGERGTSDCARDPRGFALRFYTEEGNCDWVMNNTPVFFIRDPSKFPVFIHTQKRNPQTNLKDATMFWDYLSSNQECINQVMILFSDRGTPDGFRKMDGWSGHTYKFTKRDGSWIYVQWVFKSRQGNHNMTNDQAAVCDPDYATADLFNAIERKDYPQWDAYVQTMTQEQADQFEHSVFDLTKFWPEDRYPPRKIGVLTLNKNPTNYFAEIEQAAFSPSHLVPGIEPSADPVLQSRLFSYPDTHRYRLGANYHQIPVNCPMNGYSPFHRDGAMRVDGNLGSQPNYPSTLFDIKYKTEGSASDPSQEEWSGKATLYQWGSELTDLDYVQANELWNEFGKTPKMQENFVYNVAVHLCNAERSVQEKTFGMFDKVNKLLGSKIRYETTRRGNKNSL